MKAYTTKELIERRRYKRIEDDRTAAMEAWFMKMYPPMPVGSTLYIPRFGK